MKIIGIVAASRNGVIGKNGHLPWSLPEDLKFFRDSTRDQIVLMGRKTYDSIGKALPKRENAVITRDRSWSVPDARVFYDLKDAVDFYRNQPSLASRDLFIIGGAEIYRLATPFMDELWITEVDAEIEGDTFFEGYENGKLLLPGFTRIRNRPQAEASPSGPRYSFSVYTRHP